MMASHWWSIVQMRRVAGGWFRQTTVVIVSGHNNGPLTTAHSHLPKLMCHNNQNPEVVRFTRSSREEQPRRRDEAAYILTGRWFAT